MSATETPRRPTPTEREHELALAIAARPAPRDARPSFSISQVKGVGGSAVIEWRVDVPECEEYPTAEEAFSASIEFARRYRSLFVGDVAAPAVNGGTE